MKKQMNDALENLMIADAYTDILHMVPSDLHHLVPGFLSRREREVRELVSLLGKHDFEGIKAIGHKLKGTGAGYGFQLFSDLGKELEAAAAEQDDGRISVVIEQLSIITTNLVRLLNTKMLQ